MILTPLTQGPPRPSRRARLLIACALALVTASVLLGGCVSPRSSATNAKTDKPVDLGRVEIREYRGKKLGSAKDFRENSIEGPQEIDIAKYRLKVSGEVTSPLTLTYRQALDRPHYRKVVRLNCVEGWSVEVLWEGVMISDLLRQAGYDSGAKTVIFHCEDGYTTSLPLEFVVGRDILLAYKMNGIDLPKERGFPFEVVAEDKWGYKWARWVTEIEVSDDADYQGYWESRGYDNDATLPSAK